MTILSSTDHKNVIVQGSPHTGAQEKRPLRILHVTPYAPEAWAYGGIPRLAGSLTSGLARRGHQVTLCTTDAADASARLSSKPPDTRRGRLQPWSFVTSDGVDVRVFPNFSNRLAYRLQLFLPLGLDHYMRRHAAGFDVAHLHACRNIPGVIAARHLARAGVPYVLAPNGTAPRIERHLLAKRVFDAVAGQRVLDGATRALAVSDAERVQLGGLGVPAASICLIPNPVDLEEFDRPVTRGSFRQRFQLPSGPLIMFLGKLTPRKRVDVLARAFARLPRKDASLVIAGNDMGAGAATRSLVHALGLDDRTCFTGLLRGRERLDALADADVLVYPSEHEIFGLAPLEALLSGTPVIVAGDSGCGEVVSAVGGGQIVPAGDVATLAGAIERVLGDPSAWRRAATEAAGRIRTAYAPDVVCGQIEHMYRGMMESTR